ncbi:lysine transporter LysE [Rhizobium sp. Root149]|uniref:Threonine/homoserine/homoserine lactone efflux protein n=1 Tax=Rhizobium rhizoryzae TaxID=451876 RepID=A0A7W6PS05_9HYPH|nr:MULTISPECIES: LysE family translocator [Rhizobium]KQZ50811.1 lysine transporter LysE [Rhizobium sp. Root149]MBB4143265.1 threonine/homoserine/homoserine lactone efflux protein [Rhizobium rhizoryzae]
MSWDFFLTSLFIVATPGTGVVITLAAALTEGRRAAVVAAFGCTLGIVPHVVAAISGLAAVLHSSALAFTCIQYAGVAYLLYMAVMMLREKGTLTVTIEPVRRSDRQTITHAVMANLLNPKLSLFFLAFLPQFVSGKKEAAIQEMLQMSFVFMAMTLAIFILYGLCAASVRDRVIGNPFIMSALRRSFAAAFVALGLKLALNAG